MFDFTSQEFIQQLPYWGYPLMFLLMIIEGTFITVVSAFLASLGFFDIFVVLFLSIIGDVISDIGLYLVGYFGGEKVINFVETKIKHNGVPLSSKLKEIFKQKGEKIIFFVKSTTGLCFTTFLLAGAIRMNFAKFLIFSVLGGIFWSSLLVTLGYFFGYAADQISQYIKYAGLAIFTFVILLILIITMVGRRRAKKFIKEQK